MKIALSFFLLFSLSISFFISLSVSANTGELEIKAEPVKDQTNGAIIDGDTKEKLEELLHLNSELGEYAEKRMEEIEEEMSEEVKAELAEEELERKEELNLEEID